jgi:hypothetical protein
MMPLVVDVDEETLHDMQLCAGFSPIGSSVFVSLCKCEQCAA